ncbi:stage 0 sporulation family protein [bacterium]|nr:stage 0 sporulation family protein [bacterium]
MEIVEIKFKSLRKELFLNTRELYLKVGNYCIVDADRGEDMGIIIDISLGSGEELEDIEKEVLRHATDVDQEKIKEARQREDEALEICQQKVDEHKLPMKLVDVECQFDGNKITFYFTSDKRIDFRELVRDLAAVFKTRIDLRQIGVRDEARRFDGVGMCGRRLCCSTFIKDFKPVTLKMAKEQNLPLTPAKISGVCGRLMCCLAFELEEYKDFMKGIPKSGSNIWHQGRQYRVEKTNIFKRTVIMSDMEGGTVEVPEQVFIDEAAKVVSARGKDKKGFDGTDVKKE